MEKDKYVGDWFGYVSVDDVSRILKDYVIGGKVLQDIWRGRCGVKDDVKKSD
jgi:(2Fe-2S) ferredoxin